MYGQLPTWGAAGTAGTLAATGVNSMGLLVAAFTLTMAGAALMRLLPRR
ncbi:MULTISPECIES: hypothetical protein [unclassified Kitasatospora]|nr:hypothetical protein [Kitasatospora sp. DSM 101779]MCU7825132.1 hypothetical protein [Kitasatospora sp. DSM 101779]